MQKRFMLQGVFVLVIVYILIFRYLPMGGIQLAFGDYCAADGIFDSKQLQLTEWPNAFRMTAPKHISEKKQSIRYNLLVKSAII